LAILNTKRNAKTPTTLQQDIHDVKVQNQPDIDEMAVLDEIYPEYTGDTINIDGKERTVFNSNGERIANSKEALTNFWQWFGDSKVVDEQGRPLVVYHGTVDKKLKEFKTRSETGISSTGSYVPADISMFFFTNKEEIAEDYGYNIENGEQTGGVLQLYLKIENPSYFDVEQELEETEESLERDDFEALDRATRWFDRHNSYVRDEAEQNNNDGIIIESDEDNSKLFIAFNNPKFAPTEQEKQTFLSDLESKQTIRLGKLPSVYTNLNWKSADVKTNKAVIVKDTELKHNVSMEVVKQLPELYSDPLLVLESATNPDRLVAVIDAKDNSGRQIVVALSPDNKKTNGYHFIPSFYGKDNLNNFIEDAVKSGRLKYIKNNQVSDSLQLRTQALGYTNNIKHKDDIVNPQIKSVDNRGTFSGDTGNIYYQIAYAGSRVDYDRPSLEAIGSGEGNLAHGWGLYYALDKNVADKYRDTFAFFEKKLNEKKTNWINFIAKGFMPYEYKQRVLLENLRVDDSLSDFQKKELKKIFQLSEKDFYNKLESGLFQQHKTQGQVHEVEIPEMEYYLDAEKEFSEQSVFVKNKLKNLPELEDLFYYNEHPQGSRIYRELSSKHGSDKAASQLLEKHGIKGITYESMQDGRCFVIFNPDDVKVLRKKFDELGNVLFQSEQKKPSGKGNRGAYVPALRLIIKANSMTPGTLSHEFAHDWFEQNYLLWRSGNRTKEFNAYWQSMMNAMGIDETASKKDIEKASETFARAFESWLLNKTDFAKSVDVDDNVFKEYQKHLQEIYTDINNPYFASAWGEIGVLKPEINF